MPRTFDPITASEDMESVRLSRLLYEGLFQVDISKAVRPGIAQPTRFLPDGRRMSIALRSGLKWSDGGEITAQDVTSTFEAMRRATNRNLQTRVADIVSVQPTGTYDLLITFRSIIDRRNMPKLLAFPILPRHKLQELPLTVRSDIAVQPVGSGFYKFVGRDAKTIHLEANEQYRKRGGNVEGPYIDKISILHIPDAASQVDHIRLGKVDILVEVPPSQIAILNAEGMSLPDYESLSFEFLAINHTNPLLAIREVRQAMEYGFDRDNILTRVYQRKGTLVAGPFPPYLKSYSLDVPPFEYNPEKAIGLLTGAGLPRLETEESDRTRLAGVSNSSLSGPSR
ncbi:MAG: ABC transporter substrate-binding protein [Ignavibacteriae bacterium]|nr:ABC transporter substrate-binding protein [Ignavibacteriota bacterium]